MLTNVLPNKTVGDQTTKNTVQNTYSPVNTTSQEAQDKFFSV
jgi:hypothetical protein